MTIITAMLLYAFGLNDTTGSFIKIPQNTPDQPPPPSPTTPPQIIDPRCFILQSSVSQQQKHGMRAGNISDDVYCPWMQDTQ